MISDYIPDSFENRLAWLKNLKTEAAAHAATLGWDAAKLTALNALLDPLIALYQAVIAAQSALSKASGDAGDLFASTSAPLRAIIAEIKANPAFTDGMGAALQIFTNSTGPEPAEIQPVIRASAHRGGVTLSGTKNYAETVNIYLRRKGGAWQIIAPKRKRLPFEDQTPLASAGVPEEREYMARGVNGDDEIGQDSDIVGATFAG